MLEPMHAQIGRNASKDSPSEVETIREEVLEALKSHPTFRAAAVEVEGLRPSARGKRNHRGMVERDGLGVRGALRDPGDRLGGRGSYVGKHDGSRRLLRTVVTPDANGHADTSSAQSGNRPDAEQESAPHGRGGAENIRREQRRRTRRTPARNTADQGLEPGAAGRAAPKPAQVPRARGRESACACSTTPPAATTARRPR